MSSNIVLDIFFDAKSGLYSYNTRYKEHNLKHNLPATTVNLNVNK